METRQSSPICIDESSMPNIEGFQIADKSLSLNFVGMWVKAHRVGVMEYEVGELIIQLNGLYPLLEPLLGVVFLSCCLLEQGISKAFSGAMHLRHCP